MVNAEAKSIRHAKLKQNQDLSAPSSDHFMMDRPFSAVGGRGRQFFGSDDQNPIIRKLIRHTAVITAAFLLISPLTATYKMQASYANQWEEEVEVGTDGYTSEFTIADVMTEDGFLLKPALSSGESDRSGFSDIFVYTVEPGDTLSSIATSFGLKKQTIIAENNLWGNQNRLRAGTKIKILPVDGLSHVVKKGDTVEKIAKKYKVDEEVIIKQNQLEDEVLIADTALIIPGATREAPVPTYYAGSSAPTSAGNYTGTLPTGRLLWPTNGKLTQGYKSGHAALDIANRAKGPIYAAAAGKVITSKCGWNGGYGCYIILDHGNDMQTLYAHNEKLYVEVGQYVDQGQTIAWMGNTGRVYGATGIHLHLEVRVRGVKYNPMNFF